jgi:hypothetical protein
MRIRSGEPSSGWIDADVQIGSSSLHASVSSVLNDGLGVAVWWLEPQELELAFTRDGMDLAVTVVRWPDSTRAEGRGTLVASALEPAADVVRAVWRGLREVQSRVPSDVWLREWRHAFPIGVLEELDRLSRPRTA